MGDQGVRDLVGYDHQRQKLSTFLHPSNRSETNPSSIAGPDWSKRKSGISGLGDIFQFLAAFYHAVTIYPLLPGFLLSLYAFANPPRAVISVLLSLVLLRPFTKRSAFVRSLHLWRIFASYFPIHLYRTAALPASGRYIFGYHPHGILSHGAFAAFATEALGFSQLFPGIKISLLTLDSNFRIPIYRDYLLLLGMGSVSRTSCENILNTGGIDGRGTGNGITIVIGGAKESLEAVPNTMRLVLRSRKGFAKLAIRTGAALVPVLAFGENDLYTMTDLDPKSLSGRVQLFFKKTLGFTVPVLYSKGPYKFDFGLTPYRKPVNIVCGRPITTRKMEDPIDEGYLDEIHARYIEELERIWGEWKDVFAESREEEMQIL